MLEPPGGLVDEGAVDAVVEVVGEGAVDDPGKH
jgi:hypothetical protein